MKIFKYPIEIADRVSILMPKGARILCFQTQEEIPCIWAAVDPGALMVPRRFRVVGTGHEVKVDVDSMASAYVGTAQMMGGRLVWHLFDLGEAS